MERLKKWLGYLTSIVSGLSMAGGLLWASYSWFTTDAELEAHDASAVAHAPLRARIEVLEEMNKRLTKDLGAAEEAARALGARYVRVMAADREPVRQLKDAAAFFYEEEYKRLVRSGKSVDDAIGLALNTPWHGRPHVR